MVIMKKIILFAFLACAIVSGCLKGDVVPTYENDIKVVFNVAPKAGFDVDTKAVKTMWAEGDQILVIFKPQGGFNLDDCENNTLRFRYNGTKWDLKDNNVSDLTSLGSEGQYWAIHHRVFDGKDIVFSSVNSNVLLTNYKGGEVLENDYTRSDYTVEDNVLTLETIELQMGLYNSQFQLSVPGLTEGEWDMYICSNDLPLDNPDVMLSYFTARESGLMDAGIVLSPGNCGNIGDDYSSGVLNGEDMSFVFRAMIYWDSDLSNEAYVAYKFCITNGTDIYCYTKPRGTWNGEKIDGFDFTLTEGNAYRLPAFTSDKWVKISE